MLLPGILLQNRYRIVRHIGHGGMGAVYEARHEELGHTVALKETFHSDDESLRRAFKREARMLAGLQHPALPRVTDYFTEGDGLFLVMEFIKGNDLTEHLTQRTDPFPVSQVLHWTAQLLNVLEYLHTQEPPVIHRDIKPNNIKLNERGDVILLDFGLAKGAVSEATSIIASKSVLGFTLTYAPLEQILKADPNVVEHLSVFDADKIQNALHTPTDARSDLYALGATLYHLLTKKQPAQSPTRALAIWSGRADPLLPASVINPQVSPAIAVVLQKALSLASADRPASAAEMRRMMYEATQPVQPKAGEPVNYSSDATLPLIITNTVGEMPTRLREPKTQGNQPEETLLLPEQKTAVKVGSSLSTEASPFDLQKQMDRVAFKISQSQSEPAKNTPSKRSIFSLPRVVIVILALLFPLILIAAVAAGTYFFNSKIKDFPGSIISSKPKDFPGSIISSNEAVQATTADYPRTVAFSPDGKRLIVSTFSGIKLWDVASGKGLTTFEKVNVPGDAAIAFSPDSKTLATVTFDLKSHDSDEKNQYRLSLFDAETGKQLLTTQTGHFYSITSIVFSPNGRILATGSADKTIKLWDADTGAELRTMQLTNMVKKVVFFPDGRKLLSISDSSEQDIKLWDAETGAELKTIKPTASSIHAVSPSPDGKILAYITYSSIELWDIETNKQILKLPEQSSYYSLAFSPNGKLLAGGKDDGTINLWDLASQTESQPSVRHSKRINSLAFSPDGKILASVSGEKDGEIKLLRLR